jgi:hypothetical protein
LAGLHGPDLEAAKLAVCNTVGFAKNVLEAEAAAWQRRANVDLDRQPSKASEQVERRYRQTKALAETLQRNRDVLPFAERNTVTLSQGQQPFFYGLAELYGMARADLTPGELGHCIDNTYELKRLSPRTEIFVRNIGLVATCKPLERLRDMRIDLPQAMRLAEQPSDRAVLGVAGRIIDTVAR